MSTSHRECSEVYLISCYYLLCINVRHPDRILRSTDCVCEKLRSISIKKLSLISPSEVSQLLLHYDYRADHIRI